MPFSLSARGSTTVSPMISKERMYETPSIPRSIRDPRVCLGDDPALPHEAEGAS